MRDFQFSAPSPLDVRLWLQQTGLWFWVNLCLGMTAISFYGYAIPSVQQDTQHIQQQVQAARTKVFSHSDRQLAASTPRTELNQFYDTLDDTQHYSTTLKALFLLGQQLALELPSGDYKQSLSEDKQIATHEINLPIVGSYPQIKDFVLIALKEHPNLSLVSMKLTRENTNQATVQVTLRFHLFIYPGRHAS